jgi:hypothetical protein
MQDENSVRDAAARVSARLSKSRVVDAQAGVDLTTAEAIVVEPGIPRAVGARCRHSGLRCGRAIWQSGSRVGEYRSEGGALATAHG